MLLIFAYLVRSLVVPKTLWYTCELMHSKPLSKHLRHSKGEYKSYVLFLCSTLHFTNCGIPVFNYYFVGEIAFNPPVVWPVLTMPTLGLKVIT